MTRRLLGCFDRTGATELAAAPAVLGADAPNLFRGGPFRVAFSGPDPGTEPVLCLLDGWLDNATELAAELGEEGRHASAEALLAAAYRRWGEGLPERMRGDFALVIWDRRRGRGMIARDQLGVRPFYLHESAGTVRFAGEISWLLAALPRRPEPDAAGLAHWIATSRRPGNDTLYAGVRRLGPGEAILLGEGRARSRRYWEPAFEQPLDLPEESLATEVRAALDRAVRARTSAQAPTGVLMSGGLDSSAVAAVAAKLGRGEIRAFSATFPEHPEADESELIAELRQGLGLQGAVAEVRAGGLLASAVEHIAAWQMPLASWGDFWVLELMRAAAAQGVGTMLDGDGGDELFGPRQYLLADELRRGRPLAALRVAGELPGAGPHVPRREVAGVLRTWGLVGALPHRLHRLGTAPLARRQAPGWLSREAMSALIASDDPAAWKQLDGPRWWADAAYGLAYGMDEAGVFEHQRRRADLAGLEARHPLLDFDLVRLGLRQPPLATLDRRFNRPVLRCSVADVLPDSVRLRPAKALFDPVIVSCLSGSDAEAVRGLLLDPGAELRAYIDQAAMERELFGAGGLREREPFRWMWRLWRLLTAELWLRAQGSPLPADGLGRPAKVAIDTNDPPTFSHLDRET